MKTFSIKGKVWKYPGPAGWYFVYIGKKESEMLKGVRHAKKVGWGYIRVVITIRKTAWETTLFPSKEGPYLLAIKADVRKKECIHEGDTIHAKCQLL